THLFYSRVPSRNSVGRSATPRQGLRFPGHREYSPPSEGLGRRPNGVAIPEARPGSTRATSHRRGVRAMDDQGIRDQETEGDRVDRRGFLKCMAWAGTGLVWTVGGGLLSSQSLGQGTGKAKTGGFSFVQISDSHIGFGKDPYKQTVIATLQEAVA